MTSKRQLEREAEANLDALSDLDKNDSLAMIYAMAYADIKTLTYKQVIRLWAPLQKERKGWRGLNTLAVATQPININSLKNRVEDLEDEWIKKYGISSKTPFITRCPIWDKGRSSEYSNEIGNPTTIECGFVYSDGDLRWVAPS